MAPTDDNLRDRLLAEHAPDPGRLTAYRKEVQTMLEQHERVLRREQWVTGVFWVYVVLVATAFLVLSGFWPGAPDRAWFSMLGSLGILVVAGAAGLVRHFGHRSHVAVLKELKQLELRVLELQEQVRGRPGPDPPGRPAAAGGDPA
jgi:hypothetical protein